MVFLFVLGYIINYAENFIPYNIIPRDRLNNPNKFNTDYVYDEMNDFSDWRGTLKSKTMEVYEKTGIQMYYLYIEIPEEITTKAKALTYINDIIKDKFDDPYGFYLVNAHHKDYKNDATFLANKQTIELTNIISNIVAKEFNSSVQDYGNPVEEFVQESVDICKEQQVSDMPVQQEVSDNVNNVDLNQYHAYNNEYNQSTYKKPSPIVSVGKDNACNIGYTQRDNVDVAPGTANPVVHKIIQNQINKNINEMLRLQRNRLYLAPTKKLTPEGRYNLYVE